VTVSFDSASHRERRAMLTPATNAKQYLGAIRYEPVYNCTTRQYWRLPWQRRGCVGLVEIGTVHAGWDVFLCCMLGAPGVFFFVYCRGKHWDFHCPLWLRAAILIESVITATASAIADGLLQEQHLWIDRRTSVLHILSWLGLLGYFASTERITRLHVMLLLLLGSLSAVFFHVRMYYTYVEQKWMQARFFARTWHIMGCAIPMLLLLWARKDMQKVYGLSSAVEEEDLVPGVQHHR